MTEAETINLRSIQHFIYCKRQWSLIALEGQWLSNDSTVLGDLVHGAVDDPYFNEKRKDKHVSRSVPVFSDTLGLYGIADCVEFIGSERGVQINGKRGLWEANVVEYKKAKPKPGGGASFADAVQTACQVMCLDEMLGTNAKGFLYYAAARHRIEVKITGELKEQIKGIVLEMRKASGEGKIFPVAEGQNCSGCSLSDFCMPKTKAPILPQQRRISKSFEDILKT
jgi:CRISPR-associated exonuclease Cas4